MGETEVRRTSHGRRHKVLGEQDCSWGHVELQAGARVRETCTVSAPPKPCSRPPSTVGPYSEASVAWRGVLHWLSWQWAPHRPGGTSRAWLPPGDPLPIWCPVPRPLAAPHGGSVPCSLCHSRPGVLHRRPRPTLQLSRPRHPSWGPELAQVPQHPQRGGSSRPGPDLARKRSQ